MLRGALAASVTPLRDGGDALDEGAFGPVVDFLVAGGLDGLLAMGTNGEGILLSVGERDFRVPMNNTLEMWAALQRMRVPSRLLVWPEENHWILNGEDSRYFYTEVASWLARWL